MNGRWMQLAGLKTNAESPPHTGHAQRGTWRLAVRSRLAVLFVLIALIPVTCYAQTLDEAINAQLEEFDNDVCGRLLGGDNASDVLTGPLAGATLCRRNPPIAGAGDSRASGKGGTPATLPSIVQQQVQEARGGKTSEEEVTGASADAGVARHGPLTFFIAAEFEALDRDVTTFEDGYKSDILRLTAGADFRVSERWLLGLAFDGSREDSDFETVGDFEVDSYGIVAFGALLPTERTFVQFYGGCTFQSYDRNRFATFIEKDSNVRVEGFANADFDADRYCAGALVGYDYPIGSVTIGPRAGVDWQRTDFDSYSETGSTGLELTFHDDHETLFQSTLGVRALVALRAGSWMVVPQGSFDWIIEYEDDQQDGEVSFVGDTRAKRFTYQKEAADGDWFELNAGVSAVLGSRLQVLGNYRTLVGHRFFDSHAGTIGLRVAF